MGLCPAAGIGLECALHDSPRDVTSTLLPELLAPEGYAMAVLGSNPAPKKHGYRRLLPITRGNELEARHT